MAKKPRFQLVGAPGNTTRWRLLGGNNVSLGSGAVNYRDNRECVAAIHWLRENLDSTRAEYSHNSGGTWRWLLYADAGLVALASHPYGRKIEARHGLERFWAAAPSADVLDSREKVADWRAKYRIGGESPHKSFE
ncbi:YegP family protein [Amycolatopsis nigrescens]|uniref:YegP family protein n=1 Tax=Amycolatopsis nigrescens TaxID=381445 RepID=UPI00037CC724|nr:YegP family protein [Amycolatopsis nigrescens]